MAKRGALIQSPAHRPRCIVLVPVCRIGHRAHRIEVRQQRLERGSRGGARHAPQCRDVGRHLVHVGAVPGVAEGQGDHSEHDEQRNPRVGTELQGGFLHLEPPIDAGQPRLADYHLLQQPFDEIGFAPAGRRRDGVRRDAEPAADGAQQAVDLGAVLRAAGEVDAP
jgi:hypothetical protein